MKKLLFILFAATALCGCKPGQVDWQYQKVNLPDDPFTKTLDGKYPRYSVYIRHSEYRSPAWFPAHHRTDGSSGRP